MKKKSREIKEQKVQEIIEKFRNAQAAILADFRGLNVEEDTELRRKFREAGVEYKVLKNTLTRIAIKEVGYDVLEKYLEGPTAIAFSYKDPVAPAKILVDFIKAHKKLELKAGIVNGKLINEDGIKALSELPPREVLIAKALGGMKAPISGLVGVLQGTIRKTVYVLNAIKEKKEAMGQ